MMLSAPRSTDTGSRSEIWNNEKHEVTTSGVETQRAIYRFVRLGLD